VNTTLYIYYILAQCVQTNTFVLFNSGIVDKFTEQHSCPGHGMENRSPKPAAFRFRIACEECHTRKIRCYPSLDLSSGACECCRSNWRKCLFSLKGKLGRPRKRNGRLSDSPNVSQQSLILDNCHSDLRHTTASATHPLIPGQRESLDLANQNKNIEDDFVNHHDCNGSIAQNLLSHKTHPHGSPGRPMLKSRPTRGGLSCPLSPADRAKTVAEHSNVTKSYTTIRDDDEGQFHGPPVENLELHLNHADNVSPSDAMVFDDCYGDRFTPLSSNCEGFSKADLSQTTRQLQTLISLGGWTATPAPAPLQQQRQQNQQPLMYPMNRKILYIPTLPTPPPTAEDFQETLEICSDVNMQTRTVPHRRCSLFAEDGREELHQMTEILRKISSKISALAQTSFPHDSGRRTEDQSMAIILFVSVIQAVDNISIFIELDGKK
jgi:hypothetical protein